MCDTPGFKDTAGPEIDISNAFGIFEAIKHCKSIRIVILVSKLSFGNRGEYVTELLRYLMKMIDNID